jgi:hypothetical protein
MTKLSRESLQRHADGRVCAAPWEEWKEGEVVDYYAPMVGDTYVRDPATGLHAFVTQEAAIAAGHRYQTKVRAFLARTATKPTH